MLANCEPPASGARVVDRKPPVGGEGLAMWYTQGHAIKNQSKMAAARSDPQASKNTGCGFCFCPAAVGYQINQNKK